MTTPIDPAGRLYRLLIHCKNEARRDSLAGTLAHYFGVESGSAAYLRALSQVVALPEEIRDAFSDLRMRGVHIAMEHFIGSLPQIEGAIAYGVENQNTSTEIFASQYSDADADRVGSASAILQAYSPEPADPSDILTTVIRTSDSLSNLLAEDSTLEPELRTLLYTLADALRRTAQTYKVSGVEAIAEERDLLIGRLSTSPVLREQVRAHPKVKDILAGFLSGTMAAATFFTTAVDAGEDVQKFIQAITAG